ncbi:hypothetical protein AHF37_05665 [Paragonimus kellicotti]|nr:hypothetical protein AHF37_05665 [Paragonimus kellicotti]
MYCSFHSSAMRCYADNWRLRLVTLLVWITCLSASTTEPEKGNEDTWTYDLKMPGVQTKGEDDYVTVRYPLPYPERTFYVVEIIPKPNLTTAHHIILTGCSQVISHEQTQGQQSEVDCDIFLFAWAHGAFGLRLPPGVGIATGMSTGIKGFQLEVHYLPKVVSPDRSGLTLVLTDRPQPRVAGILLMLVNKAQLDPGLKNVSLEVSCRSACIFFIQLAPWYFDYSDGYAHSCTCFGRAIIGYRLPQNNSPAQLLGRGNPQWPQSFYSLRDLGADFNSIDLNGGDVVMSRCVYDTTATNQITRIGSTHKDEMCNLYMLYHSRIRTFQLSTFLLSFPVSTVAAHGCAAYGSLHIVISCSFQLFGIGTAGRTNDHELVLVHRTENLFGSDAFDQNFRFQYENAFLRSDPVLHMNATSWQPKFSWGANLFILPHGLRVTHKRNGEEPEAVFITDLALHQVFKFDWGQWTRPSLVLGHRFEPGSSTPSDVLPKADSFCSENEFPRLTHMVMDKVAHIFPPNSRPLPVTNSVSDLLGTANGKPRPLVGLPKLLQFGDIELGQLFGIGTAGRTNDHELVLVHRTENLFGSDAFDQNFRFQYENAFLRSDPVLHMNATSWQPKFSWGANLFILPHGLRVTHKRNGEEPEAVFITDLALHQVFKFDWGQWTRPSLVLGHRFEPGSSTSHFCQPTDVVVSSTGDIFVADGYCNSRIVKFAANGTYLTHWSVDHTRERQKRHTSSRLPIYLDPRMYTRSMMEPVQKSSDLAYMSVGSVDQSEPVDSGHEFSLAVHSLTWIPSDIGSLEQVCATVLESAEIPCFTTDGSLVSRYAGSGLLSSVRAVEYSSRHKILLAVTRNDDSSEIGQHSHGVLVSPVQPQNLHQLEVDNLLASFTESAAIVGFFPLPGIQEPYNLALSPDGRALYLVENGAGHLFQLTISTNESPVQPPVHVKNFFKGTVLAKAGDWVSHKLTGAQLAGLVMLIALLLFILTVVCIRICWCGRKSSKTERQSVNKSNGTLRWSGRPRQAHQAGFRPLNQEGENSDGPDYSDEEDQEDVLLQMNRNTRSMALRIDAEKQQRITDRVTLKQLATAPKLNATSQTTVTGVRTEPNGPVKSLYGLRIVVLFHHVCLPYFVSFNSSRGTQLFIPSVCDATFMRVLAIGCILPV